MLWVREMQLFLLGNMNRLWLSPSLHVGFESLRLLSHCRTGCCYSAFLHKEPCSDSTTLLRLMLNEKLCHVQVTSFTAQCMLLLEVPATILSAAAMALL